MTTKLFCDRCKGECATIIQVWNGVGDKWADLCPTCLYQYDDLVNLHAERKRKEISEWLKK